jgi:serine O-acetyltransferase
MRDKTLETRRTKEIRQANLELTTGSKRELPAVLDVVKESCQESGILNGRGIHFSSHKEIAQILEDLRDLLHPGCFGDQAIEVSDLADSVQRKVTRVFNRLSLQISMSLRHGCMDSGRLCAQCMEFGEAQAITFLKKIPELRRALRGDIEAAFDRDPAAKSLEEIVLSYPGVLAITFYRLAHELWLQKIPFIPRMMTEYAHSITGIDIHPGATIGSNFFIDHGTGVVIGETTIIGNNVTIYQGVTLGAYKFRRAADGSLERDYKRHPTIGDNVIIYSGATILGGDAVIGAHSVIGGNVWLTHSVPAGAVVTIEEPDLKYRVGY